MERLIVSADHHTPSSGVWFPLGLRLSVSCVGIWGSTPGERQSYGGSTWLCLLAPSAHPCYHATMKTIRVYRLNHLSSSQFSRLKAAQQEAAAVWNSCMEAHKTARQSHATWPHEQDLRHITKGRFALHSQTIQAIVRMFLTN